MASAAYPTGTEEATSPERPSRAPPAPPTNLYPDIQNENISDKTGNTAAVANGAPQNRASPSPHPPNGKPTSPYVKESNPMGGGPQTVTSRDPKAAAQAASDMRNVVRRKLTGYVGFANLPNQWHRKSVRKGFNFNVMVVGMSSHLHSACLGSDMFR